MSEKVDFKKTLETYRARAGEWDLIEVPDLAYLAIDGHGDPNAPAFAEAVSALYPVAYAMKFASKAAGRDYVVPPLEGLWWADDPSAFASGDKSGWSWTVLILTPPWVDAAAVAAAIEATRPKGAPPRLEDVRRRMLSEGRSMQTLHIGSYADEGPTLKRLHQEILPSSGLAPRGRHHEIYLSDPGRTAPDKLKTILRQPVSDA